MSQTLERIVKIAQAIQLQKWEPTARHSLIFFRPMASCIEIVSHAQLFMRPVRTGKKFTHQLSRVIFQNKQNKSSKHTCFQVLPV